MDAIPQIKLGAIVCRMLKKIYWPEALWVDCHQEVAVRLTQLKSIVRKDRSDVEVLTELSNLDEAAIQGLLVGFVP